MHKQTCQLASTQPQQQQIRAPEKRSIMWSAHHHRRCGRHQNAIECRANGQMHPLFLTVVVLVNVILIVQSASAVQFDQTRSSNHVSLPAESQRYIRKPTDQTVNEHSNVTIFCEIQKPHGEVQWVHNDVAMGFDRTLQGFPHYSIIGNESLGHYNLHIEDVQLSHRGNYSCEVSPHAGRHHLKHTGFLEVRSPPKFMNINASHHGDLIKKSMEDYVLRVNYDQQQVQLSCLASGSSPSSTVRWLTAATGSSGSSSDHRILEALNHQEQIEKRITHEDVEYVTFDAISVLTLQIDKRLNSVELVCEAQHDALQRTSLRAKVSLIVNSPPLYIRVFSLNPESNHAIAGRSYTVRCEAHGGNPAPTFQWFHNRQKVNGPRAGLRLPQEDMFINDYTFISKPGNSPDNLTCLVTNEYTESASRKVLDRSNVQSFMVDTYYGPRSVRLTQQSPSRISQSSELNCVENERLIVKCDADFVNPTASISWTLDSVGLVALKETTTKGTGFVNTSSWVDLVISRSHNNKQLMCTALNPAADISKSTSAKINVIYDIDTVTIEGYKRGQILGVSRVLTLFCHVKGGNPKPQVVWYADKTILPSESDLTDDGIISTMRTTLQESDSGSKFICQANLNKAGNLIPKYSSVKIKMHFRPTKLKLTGVGSLYNVNDIMTVTCESSLCNPRPSIIISIKRPLLGIHKLVSKTNVIPNDQSNVRGEGYFAKATAQHVINEFDHAAEVQCELSFPNSAMDLNMIEKSHVIRVNHKPKFLNEAVRFNTTQNENLVIRAEITAYPDNTAYKWLNPQMREIDSEIRIINSHRVIAKGPMLFLHNIQRTMAGMYVCEATNVFGTNSQHFDVNIFYAPNVEVNDDFVLLTAGGVSRIRCLVDANPISINDLCWFKDSKKLTNNGVGHTVIYRDNELILKIHNTTEKYAGQYTCMAKNHLGSNSKSLAVFVRTPPTISKDLAHTKYATESDKGLTASIKCVVRAVPDSEISWSLPNAENDSLFNLLNNTQKYRTTKQTLTNFMHVGILEIQNFVAADQQMYICTAKNELGTDRAKIQLMALSAPEPPINFKVSTKNFQSISVNWDTGFDGGKPQWFRIRYRVHDSNRYIYEETQESASSYIIDRLEPKTRYFISIKAVNALGESIWVPESELSVKTKGDKMSVSGLIFFDKQNKAPRLPVLLVFIICTISACLLLFTVILITCVVQRNRKLCNDLDSTTNTFETDANTADMLSGEGDRMIRPIEPSLLFETNKFDGYQRFHMNIHTNNNNNHCAAMNFEKSDDVTTPLFNHSTSFKNDSSPVSDNYNVWNLASEQPSIDLSTDTTRHYNVYGRTMNEIPKNKNQNHFSQSSYDNLQYSNREYLRSREHKHNIPPPPPTVEFQQQNQSSL